MRIDNRDSFTPCKTNPGRKVLREVPYGSRYCGGRFWCASGATYTNQIERAGLYDWHPPHYKDGYTQIDPQEIVDHLTAETTAAIRHLSGGAS